MELHNNVSKITRGQSLDEIREQAFATMTPDEKQRVNTRAKEIQKLYPNPQDLTDRETDWLSLPWYKSSQGATMTEKLIFVTGNLTKFAEAQRVAEQYGINLQSQSLDIPEIQSSDPMAVAEAKAKAAYQVLQCPVVVHDSSWSIPALNGFPGAYMHDVANWFKPEDWLNLMRDQHERTIEVCESVTFYDGQEMKSFQYRQKGTFTDQPSGENGNSLEKVVIFTDNQTIAEHHDLNINNNSVTLQAWEEFFSWYQKEMSFGSI